MDKKGQMDNTMGMLLVIFVTIITGVILFQVIAQQVGSSTNTVTANSSETLAVSGSSIYIEEYRALSGVTIVNASNQSQTVPATNYTITNNALNPTTGALSVQVTTNDGDWNSSAVYVQGTAQPLTYIADSGGRSVAALIVILFALAIMAVAISPVGMQIKEYFDM